MNRPHAHVANELETAIKEKLPESCGFVLVLFDPYGRPAVSGETLAIRYEFRSDIPEMKMAMPKEIAAFKDPAVRGVAAIVSHFLDTLLGKAQSPWHEFTRGSE